jgi:hypothetical protein
MQVGHVLFMVVYYFAGWAVLYWSPWGRSIKKAGWRWLAWAVFVFLTHTTLRELIFGK